MRYKIRYILKDSLSNIELPGATKIATFGTEEINNAVSRIYWRNSNASRNGIQMNVDADGTIAIWTFDSTGNWTRIRTI